MDLEHPSEMALEHPSEDLISKLNLNSIPDGNNSPIGELIQKMKENMSAVENELNSLNSVLDEPIPDETMLSNEELEIMNEIAEIDQELNALTKNALELDKRIGDMDPELGNLETPVLDPGNLLSPEEIEINETIQKLDLWFNDHTAFTVQELETILDMESGFLQIADPVWMERQLQREKNSLMNLRGLWKKRRLSSTHSENMSTEREKLAHQRKILGYKLETLENRQKRLVIDLQSSKLNREHRREILEIRRETLTSRRETLEMKQQNLACRKFGIWNCIRVSLFSYTWFSSIVSSRNSIVEWALSMNPIVKAYEIERKSLPDEPPFILVGSRGSKLHYRAIMGLLEPPMETNDILLALNKVFAEKVFPRLSALDNLEERDSFGIYSDIIQSIPSSQVRSLQENVVAGQPSGIADSTMSSERKPDCRPLFHHALSIVFKQRVRENAMPEKLEFEARRKAFSAIVFPIERLVTKFRIRDVMATSASITPMGVEVQVLRIRVTPDWSKNYLTSLISGRLPLKTSDTMGIRCENHGNEDDLSVVYKCDSCFRAGVRPPEGLILLWQLLNTSPERFSHVSWDVPPVIPGYHLGYSLGIGGSAAVFSVSKLDDAAFSGVAKVFNYEGDHAWVPVTTLLDNEAKSLKLLEDYQIPNVPRLIQRFDNVQFDERSHAILLMTPLGDPLLHVLREAVDLKRRKEIAQLVQRDILQTLRWVHTTPGVELAHLDVKPANIVLFENRAYLIDWGNSSKLGSQVGFRGTEAFTSKKMQSVILGGTVEVEPSMDIGSLFWTIVAILNGGYFKGDQSSEYFPLLTGFELDPEMAHERERFN